MATNITTAASPSYPRFPEITVCGRRRPVHLPTGKALRVYSGSNKRTPPSPSTAVAQDESNPSLAEQLKPLSDVILSVEADASSTLTTKPKSTWINPTRPRPSVLSPQRQKRPSFSAYSPKIRDLRRFVKELNDCEESDFTELLPQIPHQPLSREDALLLLNGMHSWQKSLLFLNWAKTQNAFPLETILYNVAMKSLRFGKQFQHVENLALEMIEKGIELDNITYSTIISCAKRCSHFDKAVEWFERMYRTGLIPDEVTYSAILDVYAKLRKVEEAMSLYERGRGASGWKPDPVTFSVLAKMFGEAGDYDGIRFILREMKSLHVQPNLVLYNTLFEALGKAGKPGFARSLFEEMVESGMEPDAKTLTALIKMYGKARWGRDALDLWERMDRNGWPTDLFLHNTLLAMCADLGLVEEAEKLFDRMKGSETAEPDSWSYSAMLNIYGSCGNANKAMSVFRDMCGIGVDLNVMGSTCLIQCLGRSRRIDDLVAVFQASISAGIKPDDRFCVCLLSVLSLCEEGEEEEEEDAGGKAVMSCLERANPKLFDLVKALAYDGGSPNVKDGLRKMLSSASFESRRPLCNCLIDVCRNRKRNQAAREVFRFGALYGVYPGLHTKTDGEWRLDARSLSIGAACTALEDWMSGLPEMIRKGQTLPDLLSANTGGGGLGTAFRSHLEEVGAPFEESREKPGLFAATGRDIELWMELQQSK
ncbi:hypothetical protein M569_03703 [Genlisea aurea]|uniref:Smr domain-containing protein n=1 Tax=Genlisea aurea TaxID=192259 RepID=S8CUK8_9LAMI|nr:hypothetical protein M569_03703 [Genlisea aurea]